MDYSQFRDYGEYLEYCYEEAADRAQKEYEQQNKKQQGQER